MLQCTAAHCVLSAWSCVMPLCAAACHVIGTLSHVMSLAHCPMSWCWALPPVMLWHTVVCLAMVHCHPLCCYWYHGSLSPSVAAEAGASPCCGGGWHWAACRTWWEKNKEISKTYHLPPLLMLVHQIVSLLVQAHPMMWWGAWKQNLLVWK